MRKRYRLSKEFHRISRITPYSSTLERRHREFYRAYCFFAESSSLESPPSSPPLAVPVPLDPDGVDWPLPGVLEPCCVDDPPLVDEPDPPGAFGFSRIIVGSIGVALAALPVNDLKLPSTRIRAAIAGSCAHA